MESGADSTSILFAPDCVVLKVMTRERRVPTNNLLRSIIHSRGLLASVNGIGSHVMRAGVVYKQK